MSKRESKFQKDLRPVLLEMFPGSIVTKLDAGHTQGIPDLLILHGDKWASLEVKKSEEEYLKCIRTNNPPNQSHYVEKMNAMSFSSYIYPENKEEVLDALQQSLQFKR